MTRIEIIRILIEVVVGTVVCGVMWRAADGDNRSPILWSAISIAICIASVAIPVPIIRPIFAGGVVPAAMFVANLIRLPPL